MIEHLLNHDAELFLYLNNLGTPMWDHFWLIITNKLTFIPLYALLLFILYRKVGFKSTLVTVVIITLMILFTDQITNLFKYGFKRLRPYHTPYVMDHMRCVAKGHSMYGFFSGHASNTMSAAVFVGLLLRSYYKRSCVLLLLWSIVVGYSRIYVGAHYPLDVFCGALFGVFSGWLWFKICNYFNLKLVK